MRTALPALCLASVVLYGCATLGSSTTPPATPAELARLEASARRDSTNAEAQLRLASAYLGVQRPDAALAAAGPVLARGGRDAPRAALVVGAAHEALANYREARASYQLALDATRDSGLRTRLRQRLVLLQQQETRAFVKAALAQEAKLAATPPTPRTVAVFPLGAAGADSLSGALAYGLTAMLITDLSQTDRLTVLDRTLTHALAAELQLARTGRVDERTAARGGRILGAERVVQGSLATGQDQLTIEAAVLRLAAGRGAQAARGGDVVEQAALAQLFDLEKRLALRLYASLGIELTAAERSAVTQRRTENLEALLAYGRGLQALDAGELARSARFFEQAQRLDPGFALAREQAAATQAIAAASAVTAQQLAATAGQVSALASAAWATTLPVTTMVRDALAELLGTEGSSVRTAIEFLSTRPGGQQ